MCRNMYAGMQLTTLLKFTVWVPNVKGFLESHVFYDKASKMENSAYLTLDIPNHVIVIFKFCSL